MKDKLGIKAAVLIAVVAVAIAGYVGMRSMGGSAGAGGEANAYTAPATGVDMEKLNANPNAPPGISGAGGG